MALIANRFYRTEENLTEQRLTGQSPPKLDKKRKINEIIDIANYHRKRDLEEIENKYAALISAPKFIFCDVYDMYLRELRKAKAFYTQIKKTSKNPVKDVSEDCPDLPTHLIDLLIDSRDSYASQPSTIAFQHVSHCLNIQLGDSDRTWRNYLKESRKLRESISDEEAVKAILEYLEYSEEFFYLLKLTRQILLRGS